MIGLFDEYEKSKLEKKTDFLIQGTFGPLLLNFIRILVLEGVFSVSSEAALVK